MIGVGSALVSLLLIFVCYSLTLTAKRVDENLLMICEKNQKNEEERGNREMESQTVYGAVSPSVDCRSGADTYTCNAGGTGKEYRELPEREVLSGSSSDGWIGCCKQPDKREKCCRSDDGGYEG